MKFIPEYNKRKLNGIYIIKNTIDSRIYVGECTNFYKRYGRHKSQLNRNVHCNHKLQAFVNKYGIDKLEFDILEICNENLIDKEIEYIIKYNSIEEGFNIILDSRTMAHVTNEARKKGKQSLRGIKRSEEFCRNVSIGVKQYYANNPKKPKAKWTEERRRKRREYIREHPERYANRRKSTGNKINHVRGSEHSNAKITEEIAYLIKLDMKNGVKRKETLERFNIPATIYKDIQRGKTWKHVKIEENYDKDKETK